jgi:5S rRNA maturation endonuclease (ribonuclease M5)
MKRIIGFTFLTLFVFSLIQVFGPGLPAQNRAWNQNNPPSEGVCLYMDADYKGEEFCIDGNENQTRMDARYNNRASSVRVFGGARLTVYEDANYKGSYQTYSQDVPNLRNWGDRVSSFQVQADRRGNRRSDGQAGGQYNDWVRGNESREGVCFYTDTNYQGDELCVDGNENQRRLDKRFRNKISSVRVSGGTQVVVFENPNFNGSSQALSQDTPNLGNWGDRIASFQVRPDSRVDRRDRGQNDGQRTGWGLGNETRNSTAGQRDGRVRDNDSRPRVCLYTDADYRGSELCLERNTNQRNLDGRFDDKVSSVRVYGGAQVIAYEHKDFGGTRRTIDRNAPGLGNFNDTITSIEVR